MKAFWITCLVLLIAMGCPQPVYAHALETNFQVDQLQKLYIKSTFSTGDPLQFGQVKVYAPNNPNTPELAGSTDAEGNFTVQLDPQQKGEWKVTIGESDHGDILYVRVTDKGIDVSQALPQKPSSGKSWYVFGLAGIAGVITSRWLARHRFWSM